MVQLSRIHASIFVPVYLPLDQIDFTKFAMMSFRVPSFRTNSQLPSQLPNKLHISLWSLLLL